MEKICGFLDIENNFHKTEKECEKSNLKINIKQIERYLNNFSNDIESYIFRNYRWNDHNINIKYNYHENEIKRVIAKCVLLHSDRFIEIINKKKEMEKTLDLLKKDKEYKDKWWIKVIWWK